LIKTIFSFLNFKYEGPNGEKLEKVEFVPKLSPYAQVDYHEREKPEYRNNFMIGK
jgi:hypothetical protein